MNAESQVFAESGFPPAPNYAGQTAGVAAGSKAFVSCLTTMLEQLWKFYDAMRSGKPLPDADLKLANLKFAMLSIIKRA